MLTLLSFSFGFGFDFIMVLVLVLLILGFICIFQVLSFMFFVCVY